MACTVIQELGGEGVTTLRGEKMLFPWVVDISPSARYSCIVSSLLYVLYVFIPGFMFVSYIVLVIHAGFASTALLIIISYDNRGTISNMFKIE